MPDPLYLISEEDKRIITDLYQRINRMSLNQDRRPPVVDIVPQAPETYLALTPSGGIPALSFVGTGSGSGTGTGGTPQEARPGSAVCQLFQTHQFNSGSVGALPLGSPPPTKVVYNWGSSAIPGNQYVIITREKCGAWEVVYPGPAGGSAAGNGAFLQTTTTTSVASANNQVLSWSFNPSTDYDTGPYFSSGSPTKLTIPGGLSGYYQIGCQMDFSATGAFTPGGCPILQILQQNVLVAATILTPRLVGSTTQYYGQVFFNKSLAAGVFFTVQVNNLATGSQTLSVDTAGDADTWFSITQIGTTQL